MVSPDWTPTFLLQDGGRTVMDDKEEIQRVITTCNDFAEAEKRSKQLEFLTMDLYWHITCVPINKLLHIAHVSSLFQCVLPWVTCKSWLFLIIFLARTRGSCRDQYSRSSWQRRRDGGAADEPWGTVANCLPECSQPLSGWAFFFTATRRTGERSCFLVFQETNAPVVCL